MVLPPGKKAIQCRWLFKIKEKSDCSMKRFKNRLVSNGFTQRKGIDYKETYTLMVNRNSVRVMLAIAATQDLEILHFGVKTAFLYGELEEELYMEQPEGFCDDPGKVWRLKKSLYGLKQSPRAWNKKFNLFLEKFGLTRTRSDSCVYVRNDKDNFVILGLYVDDGLLCASKEESIEAMMKCLRVHFEISADDPNSFVGMQLKRNREMRTIKIHQGAYIKRILE
jgi:hypothetical protein